MNTNRMTTEQAIDYLVETGGDIQSGDGTTDATFAGDTVRTTVRHHGMTTRTTYSVTDFGNRERGRFWRSLPMKHFDGRDGVLPESELERRAGE